MAMHVCMTPYGDPRFICLLPKGSIGRRKATAGVRGSTYLQFAGSRGSSDEGQLPVTHSVAANMLDYWCAALSAENS